jgi:hypothetical protein
MRLCGVTSVDQITSDYIITKSLSNHGHDTILADSVYEPLRPLSIRSKY